MPEVGDPCGAEDTIEKSSTGEFLVCRNGVWQNVDEAPPFGEGALPSRERREAAAAKPSADDPKPGGTESDDSPEGGDGGG
jgi:hypothetical protein